MGIQMLKQFNQALSQKEKSLKQLYVLISELGPISKSDLIEHTGLTQTTCSRLIEELINLNLIIESGFGESSGGRKPHLYEIKPDVFHLIGIDISRTYTKILLMDLSLNVKAEARLKMDQTCTPDATIHFIEEKIKNMLREHQLETNEILGVGIGAIGPLDRQRGMILNPVDFPSPGWVNVPIKDILSERLGLNVVIDYGVNTALLAEYKNELFKSYKNVVYVIKGVGNRSSIILDGRLARGSDKLGMYGQGHMVVDIHGRKCICGGYGCVHAYSSISVIKKDVIDSLKLGKDSILKDWINNIEDIQFEDICQAVNENDPLCCQIIKDAGYYAGVGLSNLITVLQPDLVILSGPTYTHMDLFYDTVTELASKRSKVIYPDHELTFSKGNLGENATAIGAGGMVLSYFLE
jgi:predicted NBD/HSP70 family sugar kinase